MAEDDMSVDFQMLMEAMKMGHDIYLQGGMTKKEYKEIKVGIFAAMRAVATKEKVKSYKKNVEPD